MRVPSALARAAVSFLFPDSCLGCGASLGPASRDLCPVCARALAPHLSVVRLPGAIRSDDLPAPELAAFALDLSGPVRALVHALKYGGRAGAARALAEAAAPALAAWIPSGIDAIVPVPLHAVRLRERGFNQADLLARRLSSALGAPVEALWLRRSRPTRTQADLGREDRLANVAGAFKAHGTRPGSTALLLDDVVTTGATLAAAAAALAVSGVRPLACAVAGRRLVPRRGAPGRTLEPPAGAGPEAG